MRIDYRLLIKSMGFMFLPTLSVLGVLVVAFWSFTNLFTFISSAQPLAIWTRVLMLALEIGCVYFVYSDLVKKKMLKDALGEENNEDINLTKVLEFNPSDNHSWRTKTDALGAAIEKLGIGLTSFDKTIHIYRLKDGRLIIQQAKK